MVSARPMQMRGVGLVELLVAMTLGLALVGLALDAHRALAQSALQAEAAARLADDGAAALALLRAQIASAGTAPAVPVDGATRATFQRVIGPPYLRGCDGAFVDDRVAFDALRCDPDDAGPDALALRWEADPRHAATTAAGLPLDCLGNGIGLTPAAAGRPAHFRAEARLAVRSPAGRSRPELQCRGTGGTGAQALLEGVEDLQLTYLVAADPMPDYAPRALAAADMSPAQWSRVVGVQICLVMVSDQVLREPPEFQPSCEGGPLNVPDDRRLRRRFDTVVSLPVAAGPGP